MIKIFRPLTSPPRRLLTTLVLVAGVAASGSAVLIGQEAPAAPVAPAAVPAPAADQAPAAPTVAQAPASAQPPAPPVAEQAPSAPPVPDDFSEVRWNRPVVRVGQGFELLAGDSVREVTVVLGSAVIAGEVDRDVVVVLGSVHLAPTAVIHGSLVTPGGSVVIEPGASIGRDFVVPLGAVSAPPGFHPGGDYVVIGPPGFSGRGEAIVPWFTRGLLWGRLIVPSLSWLWTVVAVVVLIYLALNLLFDRPVRLCRQMIAERPLSAFLVGLLVLVLIGPVSFILSVSIIGIPVVPFLACGLLIAALLGKVGLTRWIGSSVIAETDPESRAESTRSFAIGTAFILLAYMVPVLGILVWAVGGIFGLGAATLAFSSGLRRENPGRKRPPSMPVPPVPPPVTRATADAQPLAATEAGGAAEFRAAADMPPVGERPIADSPASPHVAAGSPAGVGRVSPVDLLAMPKAPFLDRLAAFALDVLLVSLTYNLLDMDSARAFFTLLLGYHIIFWGLKATTVGGIICNLRIVRTDGAALTFADALIRGFSSIFSIVALGIGCLWILYDPDNQAWHDRFAGTYVVKVPRNWPV